jgi:hypothetical protein
MSKETKDKDDESSSTMKNWSYDGSEDDWNTFDRRMQRYMRKKLGTFGESIWLWTIPDFVSLELHYGKGMPDPGQPAFRRIATCVQS